MLRCSVLPALSEACGLDILCSLAYGRGRLRGCPGDEEGDAANKPSRSSGQESNRSAPTDCPTASLSSPVGVVESCLPLCVVEVFERGAESRSVTHREANCGALTSALRSRVGNVVELIRERASKLPYSFRQSVDGHAFRPLGDSAEEEHFVRAAERNRPRRADRLESRSYCVGAFKVTDLVEQLVAAAPR
jgi:hypothetical protein